MKWFFVFGILYILGSFSSITFASTPFTKTQFSEYSPLPSATVVPDISASKAWDRMLKKGYKRADVLVVKNNRLETSVYIEQTVQCLQNASVKTLQELEKTPKKAYTTWMKSCAFAKASVSIEKQQLLEKKQALQKKLTRFTEITIPQNVINSVTNSDLWDANTKTLLGNNQPIYHSLESQKTEDFDTLGIRELIGVGLSNFAGSDKNRISNFSNAAQKLDGIIIHPGESFSTLKTISPFTVENGYTIGKVIIDGKLEEEIGGGVCQAVTTLFRSWNNAGLEIAKTQPHSKVVGYYGNIGLDATLYEGVNYESSVDLVLKNDSENSVLIQSVIQNGYEMFLLYSTKDRKTTLSRTGFEETDAKTKATWKRTVELLANGEKIEKVFTQNQKKPEKK